MKFNLLLALCVIVGLVACSNALPARKRMAQYRQQQRYWSRPQRLMYMQYVQPARGNGRSTQAAAALVAGESVATGTYLQGSDGAVAAPAATFSSEAQNDEAAGTGAQSVAEAYPDDQLSVNVNLDAGSSASTADETYYESEDAAKEGREYSFDTPAGTPDVEVSLTSQTGAGAGAGFAGANGGAAESEAPAYSGDAASVGVNVNVPAPVPFSPAVPKPAGGYLPSKKKVYVELEHSAEAESDADNAVAVQDDDEDESDVAPKYPARVPNGRYPVAKKPAKGCVSCKAAKPLPAGTFFPVEFGGTTGGAIAIANSFSTGESGSATSHAIAYGSPDQARARVPARRRRH